MERKFKYIPKTSQTCLVCNQPSLKLSNYCSTKCYHKHTYIPKQRENTCLSCQVKFTASKKLKYCSKACGISFRYWSKQNSGLCLCGKPKLSDKTTCEKCRIKRRTYKPKEPRPLEQVLLSSMKKRAKKKNLPFNVGIEDVIIPEFCPVLGIKLCCGIGKTLPSSPTIDRFVPELGYVKGNIFVISHRANTIKQDADINEVKLVLEYMTKNHKV